jgi:hypothetical protein
MKTNARRLSIFVSLILVGFARPAIVQVYAACLTGYVNVPLTSGYTFTANPMMISPDNTLNSVTVYATPRVPSGTTVYLWDVTNQTWSPPSIFVDEVAGWSLNYDVPPGKGFVVYSPVSWTNTFLGEVFHGTNLCFLGGGNKWSLVSFAFPAPRNLSNLDWMDPLLTSIFPWIDGENVYLFEAASQRYSDAFTCFDGYGWFDPKGVAGTNGPTTEAAQSFFVQNPGPDANWVTIRDCSAVPGIQAAPAVAGSATPRIGRIGLRTGIANLGVNEPEGAYNVEWSSDGSTWKILAAGQTGSTWTGPVPPGPRGYFRLTQP